MLPITYKYFHSYKGRNVLPGQRVEVYRNLRYKNESVYSVRDPETRLVLGHSKTLLLTNCNFIVQETGRQRVLREKRKNVHAWIEGNFGIVHNDDEEIFGNGAKVTYNPYQNERFVREADGGGIRPVFWANLVWIDENVVFASGL